ncbi:unnamed protein product [Moneuplotes crassus]|uniref:Mitochondrial cardiolipin hydrolase n=1 Tax=Euplotes crassus TaxID=5936 RepID=A0AAD1UMR2_EUPCR|nr:unnamed protein product [Moneuplotes crassus]
MIVKISLKDISDFLSIINNFTDTMIGSDPERPTSSKESKAGDSKILSNTKSLHISLTNDLKMKKTQVLKAIRTVEIDSIRRNEIDNIQDDIKKTHLPTEDVKTSLIANLVNKEKWDVTKAMNFLDLSMACLSSTPYQPNNFEKVLKFPSHESENELLHYLSMAQESIKVCMYTFTKRELMNCLIEAKKRGIRVQVIMDKESLSTLYIHELCALGVECTHHNLSNSAKMHHKFAIVDDLILINGSLNWTARGVKQNHENVMVSSNSARKVQKEMEIRENKRIQKEKERRYNKYTKQVSKLFDSFKNAREQCYKGGDITMEDQKISVEIEKNFWNLFRIASSKSTSFKLPLKEIIKNPQYQPPSLPDPKEEKTRAKTPKDNCCNLFK